MPDVSNDQLSNLFFKQYNQVYDTQKSLETSLWIYSATQKQEETSKFRTIEKTLEH